MPHGGKDNAMLKIRIGHGYDVHKLTPDRPLILGGVQIPSDKGLLGHSDADVLLHSICDALFGAAALGDIGRHFPDSDEKYRGISSRCLLKETVKKLKDNGFAVSNIDATVAAQAPKLSPFISQMVKNIAADCEISEGAVNVKATTEEGLGFTGSGEGMSATAVCLIYKIEA